MTVEADITALVRSAAAGMLARSAELSAALARQIALEVPELAADPVLVEALARSVLENFREATGRLAGGDLRPDGEVPDAALDYARRLAERGIPASALLRAYRIGQARAQEQIGEGLAESGADPAIVIAATRMLSSVAFEYVDGISERVVRAHEQARLRWEQGVTRAAADLVAALLADRSESVEPMVRSLGYALDQAHVAVVIWSDAELPALPLPRGARSLVVPVDSTTLWAWLPVHVAHSVALGSARRTSWAAISEPAAGPAGFIAGHRQARRVQALVSGLPRGERPQVVRAEDVRLPLLLAQDPDTTASWVAKTLGDLALDDTARARLRETLRVFLDEGSSFSAAAERLGIHRNTVLYRVHRAEAALGSSLRERRLEVEAALLAARWLGRAVLTRPASSKASS